MTERQRKPERAARDLTDDEFRERVREVSPAMRRFVREVCADVDAPSEDESDAEG